MFSTILKIIAVGILSTNYALAFKKEFPHPELMSDVISFSAFNFAVRLPENRYVAVLPPVHDICSLSREMNIKIDNGFDYYANCNKEIGRHFGVVISDKKISYILQSKKSKYLYAGTPANYDHETYHSLRYLGEKKQIDDFHKLVRKITRGKIDLAQVTEEEAAQAISLLSTLLSGVSPDQVTVNTPLLKKIHAIESTEGLVRITTNDQYLISLAHVSPSLYKVYSDLISIHSCEANNSKSILNKMLSRDEYLMLMHNSNLYSLALSKGKSPC